MAESPLTAEAVAALLMRLSSDHNDTTCLVYAERAKASPDLLRTCVDAIRALAGEKHDLTLQLRRAGLL